MSEEQSPLTNKDILPSLPIVDVDSRTDVERFNHYFPTGSVSSISIDQLPPTVKDYYEHKKSPLQQSSFESSDYERVLKIEQADGSTSYAVQFTKLYDEMFKQRAQVKEISIYELNNTGKKIGSGEIQFEEAPETDNADFFRDKPSVSWTETSEEFQKKGFGRRRLLLMNGLTQMLYKLPLHSDIVQLNEQGSETRIWEKLVAEGKARKYRENSGLGFVPVNRYAFIK